MNNLSIHPFTKNIIPVVIGAAIGYLATRIVQWICRDTKLENRSFIHYLFPIFKQSTQPKDVPLPSEVCIELVTIKKFEKNHLDPKFSKLSLAEFLKKVPYQELNNLRKSVGWLTRTKEIWDKVIPNSSYIVCVMKEDEHNQTELIANGFLLGNGRMGTILDVAVQPKYQKKQIGTLIMNHIIQHIKASGQDYAGIGLFASGKDEMKFYSKFGFKENHSGMEAWGKDLNICHV